MHMCVAGYVAWYDMRTMLYENKKTYEWIATSLLQIIYT